jgi:hypothetical protein
MTTVGSAEGRCHSYVIVRVKPHRAAATPARDEVSHFDIVISKWDMTPSAKRGQAVRVIFSVANGRLWPASGVIQVIRKSLGLLLWDDGRMSFVVIGGLLFLVGVIMSQNVLVWVRSGATSA